jgi:hypothetical protein
VNVVTNEARAHIGERAADYVVGQDPVVIAHGDVTVRADDDTVVSAAAGNVGGGGTAGIGIASTTIVTSNTVEAFIGSNAEVQANAMGGTPQLPKSGVSVSAVSTEQVRTAAVGGTFGGTAGVAGSATVTVLSEKHWPSSTAARVNQASGAAEGQRVEVRASDETLLFSLAGALAGGGTAGIGAGADVLVINKQTEAQIAASAAVEARNNVIVRAYSDEYLTSISAALGAGGTAGIGGAASVPVLDISTRAFIGPMSPRASRRCQVPPFSS